MSVLFLLHHCMHWFSCNTFFYGSTHACTHAHTSGVRLGHLIWPTDVLFGHCSRCQQMSLLPIWPGWPHVERPPSSQASELSAQQHHPSWKWSALLKCFWVGPSHHAPFIQGHRCCMETDHFIALINKLSHYYVATQQNQRVQTF